MMVDILGKYWALVAASVLGAAVLLFLVFRVFEESDRGRLLDRVRELRSREREANKAQKAADRAAARLERLRARADSVKPRLGQEASEALEDARALQKIADDQVLVARNHVRKIILEEYPPKRHAAMRAKYLRQDEADQKPFTMEA
jgi:uncharacterized protein YlxW (UPF0749 family)